MSSGVKDAKSADDCEPDDSDARSSGGDNSEAGGENTIRDFNDKPSLRTESDFLGMTDLERAYQDILDQPVSPGSIGGMKSLAKTFKTK